jgi:protoporphyrinogen oxidase
MGFSKTEGRIIVIGAGPTGLGAAYRLSQLQYENWAIYEKQPSIGGLSSSFMDEKGFTWDIGGHVMFSSIVEFNQLVNLLLGEDFISHDRESWIRMLGRWIPYPFQNNVRHLPPQALLDCLRGLVRAQCEPGPIANFEDWILHTFGRGIADHFMLPYNFKVWAYPADMMGYDWIAKRVSVVDVEKILQNVIMSLDDTGWGPNNQFKFPLHGGTGGFFQRFEPFVRQNLYRVVKPVEIDMDSRIIAFDNGRTEYYRYLINTSPLDQFVKILRSRREDTARLRAEGETLAHNGVHIIGIGLRKRIKDGKCWVYFPEEDIPFYRLTYFSHYSPHNVPHEDTENFSSLLCEVSFSPFKPVREEDVTSEAIRGLIKAGILAEEDRACIISTWRYSVEHAYPIPTLGRDASLQKIQTVLERNNIYSRGRFGAWKYETGNMDHSVMMGIEAVDNILCKTGERIWNL